MGFMKPRIIALSHSRMKTWETCPRKAQYKFVNKLKEPGSPAMDRGSEVHSTLEHFLQGKEVSLEAFTPETQEYMAELSALGDVQPEMQVAFDRDWNVVEWFHPSVFMRVVYDALVDTSNVTVVVDHKTGKKYDDHVQQEQLYAFTTYLLYGKPVEVQFNYTDLNEVTSTTYDVSEMEGLKLLVEERAKPILDDEDFHPNPSYKCRWCFFRKSNMGPCSYG